MLHPVFQLSSTSPLLPSCVEVIAQLFPSSVQPDPFLTGQCPVFLSLVHGYMVYMGDLVAAVQDACLVSLACLCPQTAHAHTAQDYMLGQHIPAIRTCVVHGCTLEVGLPTAADSSPAAVSGLTQHRPLGKALVCAYHAK